MIRLPPRSTQSRSSAASDVYKRQVYKGYVNARVGVKQNSYREHHEDAHYLFARNKYRRELASLEDDLINIISTDDMAKLKVGAPAVSRYHQLTRLYGANDQLNLLIMTSRLLAIYKHFRIQYVSERFGWR